MAKKVFEAESATRYTVKRSGVKVPKVEIIPDKVDEELSLDEAVAVTVISVHPPVGSTVPRGTKVDITLAPSWKLKPPVLKRHHRDLRELPFEEIYTRYLKNEDVKRIVSEYRSVGTMPGPEKTRLLQALRDAPQGTVTIGADPGTTADDALETLRGALTFGSKGK